LKPVLLDTGVIVALLDRSQSAHRQCAAVAEDLSRPLASCEAVIAEACYLLRDVPHAEDRIIANVEQGIFQLSFQLSGSSDLVRNVMKKYLDLPASLADACLVCLAEQLDTGDILTLDRHFETYRWRKNRPFNLLVPPT
jgi:predicted nucleic acid-binding protein